MHDVTFSILDDRGFDCVSTKISRFLPFCCPCYVVSDISHATQSASSDTSAVLEDFSQNFKLYFAHLMRCHVQGKRIEATFNKLY